MSRDLCHGFNGYYPQEVISEAVSQKAELIISHHPVIFQPLKRLSPTDVPYLLVQNGLCAIAAHTNYDLACGGVNACLAERLQLKQISMLEEYEHSGLAASLIGQLETAMKPSEFAAYVKTQLECKGLKFTVGKTAVKKVAVACGAGSSSVFAAGAAGADAFVSGDSKHHELLAASAWGLPWWTRDILQRKILQYSLYATACPKHFRKYVLSNHNKKTLYSIWFNFVSLKGGETWL